MCNIAGYIGNKRAVPVLLQMMKREEYFDGGFSTGVATIYNGKIYSRKILGTVDDLIRETDVMDLPGNIGFIHSRPANNAVEWAHPHISNDGKISICDNGICFTDANTPMRDKASQMLVEKGYKFLATREAEQDGFPQFKKGSFVSDAECIALLTEEYFKETGDLTKAFARANDDMRCDLVSLMISPHEPDSIKACRTSRPMHLLMAEDESYIATTQFAFPDDVDGRSMSLPLDHICKVKAGAVEITPVKTKGTPEVRQLDPISYREAYDRIYYLLKGRKTNPADYDEIEVAVWLKTPELWKDCEDGNYCEFARLTYEILFDLHKRGLLRMEIRNQEKSWGIRPCAFMWID